MLLYDLIGNRQSEPSSLADLLGAEEWVEDLRQHVLRDALSGVRHLDLHAAVIAPRRKRDRPFPVLHGLHRVGDQIEKHLIHLGRRAYDRRYPAEALVHLHGFEHVVGERERAVEGFAQVEAPDLASVQTAEVLEVPEELRPMPRAAQAVLNGP